MLKPVATAYPMSCRSWCGAASATSSATCRRLVCDQQRRCRASSRTASRTSRASTPTLVRPVRPARHRHRNRHRSSQRGLRSDAGPLRHRRRRYMVLPLLGPSTVRDAAALPLDRLATPPVFFDGPARSRADVLQVDQTRANLLGASQVSTTSRSTSTPSCATPICSAAQPVFDGNLPETAPTPEAAGVRCRRAPARRHGGPHRRLRSLPPDRPLPVRHPAR